MVLYPERAPQQELHAGFNGEGHMWANLPEKFAGRTSVVRQLSGTFINACKKNHAGFSVRQRLRQGIVATAWFEKVLSTPFEFREVAA
jgi:hypothetical protein